MNVIEDSELRAVINEFGVTNFSTLEVAELFARRFPDTWSATVNKYGQGGKSAGRHYTAYSFLANRLSTLAERGEITKLSSVPAPQGFGSPIISMWSNEDEYEHYSGEQPGDSGFEEGSKQTVVVDKFERSKKARVACIKEHGSKCKVCSFDFGLAFGELGTGFIHVHHLVPLSQIGASYRVDPKRDLVPICPNCHAMIHRTTPPMSIEELIRIRRQRK